MAKYTPGPWEIRHRLNVAKGNCGIANCGGYSDNNNQEQAQDENEANVRLIAAAPDLLAACKAVLAAANKIRNAGYKIDEMTTVLAEQVEAAIARAKEKTEADND